MNYLAIDFGEKNVGIAFKTGNDPIVPSEIINYGDIDDLIVKITKIVNEKKIDIIIIGMPLTLKGEKGHQAKIVEKFSHTLRQKINLPIKFIDERFSSSIFQEVKNIDSYSAAEILGSYISRKNC